LSLTLFDGSQTGKRLSVDGAEASWEHVVSVVAACRDA
jgi:hypothetical protein